MQLSWCGEVRRAFRHFNPLEVATCAYAVISGVYILCLAGRVQAPFVLLLSRAGIVCGMGFLALWHARCRSRIVEFVRAVFPLMLITYWYPETYYLNHGVLFPVHDAFFDGLDVRLFGCRPPLEFSKALPAPWFAELMYFAYFSFFLTYIYIGCLLFFKYPGRFYPFMFVVLVSFFLHYVFFVLVPVEGPQFYWPYPDNQVPDGYWFSKLLRFGQRVGEKPTGAFPSSHVSMTLIFLWVLFRVERKSFWALLPVACLLFASTVYVKAHYLVDVLAGFVAAPVVCCVARKLYDGLCGRFPWLDCAERKWSDYERTK